MSCSSVRRAQARLRRLALAVILLAPWLAPGTPPVVARSGSDSSDSTNSDTPGCGHNWSSARLFATLPGDLLEVSGFASSARYPGVAWMIRDSQNPDSLYSFELDSDDEPHWKEFPVSGGTSNHDWEDVAYTVGDDGRGRLWILENDNAGGESDNSSMKIYEVLEPDPDDDRSARLAGTYRFEYPDENLDTEALFTLGGKLLVVAKTDPNRVFRFPSPMSRSGTNQLTEVGGLDASSLLTAVGTSGDERLLVTVGISDDVRVFENRSGTGEFSAFDDQGPVFSKSMPETQRESIDFFPYNGCDIISVSEDGTVWRLSNPRTVYPEGAPGPPTGVSAVAGDGSVRVSWSPPANLGGSGITGYRVAVNQQAVEIAARFFGSMGGQRLNAPVQSLVPDPDGAGYRLVASDGGVFAFDVPFRGSRGATRLNKPVTGMVRFGDGYLMVGEDGGIFNFSDRPFSGSLGDRPPPRPIVSVAALD